MDYKIEQLLPLAAELADRYTSKESTSVTYETAGALMEAVLYCMKECEDEGNASSARAVCPECGRFTAVAQDLS